MSGLQWVDRIAPVGPSPSLLTSARNRSSDNFGDPSRTVDLGEGETRTVESWTTGIAWTPTACAPASVWPRCPGPDDEKDDPADRSEVATDAFTIYTPMACEWVTPESVILEAASTELTEAHTARAVARALALGDGLPDTINLTDGTPSRPPTLRRSATTIAGTFDLDDAVAQLLAHYEDCTGGSGGAMLHLPSIVMIPALGGSTGGGWVARPEGNFYRGPLGSIVSPGPGYPLGASIAGAGGFGPKTSVDPAAEAYHGNTSSQVWLYVTGPVEYALSDIVVLPETELQRRSRGEHRQNTYEVWAERKAIVRFDPCCVFGALTTVPAGAFA